MTTVTTRYSRGFRTFGRITRRIDDSMVTICDAATGQERFTLGGRASAVVSMAFSPDGRQIVGQQIVSGSEDAIVTTVKTSDAETGKETLTTKARTTGVGIVAFSSDGRRIISRSYNTVNVWDAVTGKEMFTIKVDRDAVLSVAFSQDGRRLVSGGRDGKVKVWETATGKETLISNGYPNDVLSVAISPDGRRIVSGEGCLEYTVPGSSDYALKIWNTATEDSLTLNWNTAKEDSLMFPGLSDWVLSVAFSPDGRRIVSGNLGGIVEVWDAASGNNTLTLKGHNGVSSVAFSPDGQRIVSGECGLLSSIWAPEGLGFDDRGGNAHAQGADDERFERGFQPGWPADRLGQRERHDEGLGRGEWQ